VCLTILRKLEVGDEAFDGGFVLRIGQGEMDAIGVEIACAGTANPAYALSVQKKMDGEVHNTHPPEAPVMSASRPASSLFTDIARPARTPNQPNGPDRIPGEVILSRATFAIPNEGSRMAELH
jgi:hypothetical protein